MFPNQGITPKPTKDILNELKSTNLEDFKANEIYHRLSLVQDSKDAYARELALHVITYYYSKLQKPLIPDNDIVSAMEIGERAGIVHRVDLLKKVFNVDYRPTLFSREQSKP